MTRQNLYASPKEVRNLDECLFYHTIEVPGQGVIPGLVDLRATVENYLGEVKFEGKRVLEVGTASGYLCFYMESKGADVVAYDLTDGEPWDFVPLARNYPEETQIFKEWDDQILKLNKGYWFCHNALQSKAKVCYGSIYKIPADIEPVDISTLCSVLLHVRDPFLAIQEACKLTKETVIISDTFSGNRRYFWQQWLGKYFPVMFFQPNANDMKNIHTWWYLSPTVIKRFIAVLGFEKAEVSYSHQMVNGTKVPLFTVVGHRTQPMQKVIDKDIEESDEQDN